MRRIAPALLALLAGCWYDRPNPWDTEDDVRAYRDKLEEDWLLEKRVLFDPPQHDGPAPLSPDLEAFRDTVLANSEDGAVERMRAESVRKLLTLEGRIRSELPVTEDSKDQLTLLVRRRREERARLAAIDARLGASGRQR